MPSDKNETQSGRSRKLVPGICLALFVITWLVFGQTLTHDFVNFDDQAYVFENAQVARGLTWPGIVWAFTHTHSFNWHPVTWISHMLDCQIFGLNAGGHHFTSVLLHSVAVILLFLVLRQMTGGPSRTGTIWRSAFVAAIFAIHPLHVESVAWVAERKDVLSAVFFLLTLGAYSRYVRNPSRLRYLAVALFLALGLMSKPMLVTVPVVLLILDWWPLNRLPDSSRVKKKGQRELQTTWLSLVAEKIPLFVLSLASCVATIIAQQQAIAPVDQLSLLRRLHNATLTIAVYLWQMIAPLRLAPLYLYSQKWMPAEASIAFLIAAILSVTVFALRRKYPYLLAGWLWYLIMLLPVLGILQVGWQAHADRYTYLPQIGLYIAIAWAVSDLSVSWRYRREILAAASGIVIVVLGALAFRQTAYWRDTESLWRHAITVTPGNYVAHTNLGDALLKKGALDEAIQTYQLSLGLSPNHADAENGLGGAFGQKGKNDEAIQHFRRAIALRPNDPEYHNNYGNALSQKGLIDEAIVEYEKALELRPDPAEIHRGETEFNLANALLHEGRIDEAITHYRESLKIQPNEADTHDNLGTALMRKGSAGEAIMEFQIAQQLNPQSITALNYLSWALATCSDPSLRNGGAAVGLAEQAKRLTNGRDPLVLRTLAAAYAEAGQFPQAVETARAGSALANARRNARLAATIEKELALYLAGSPYHEPVR